MNKISIIALVIVFVLVGVLFAFQGKLSSELAGLKASLANAPKDAPLGASAGPDQYSIGNFRSGLISGGRFSTSTSGAIIPFRVQDIAENTLLDVTLNIQDADIKFPASTTLFSLMPNAGDTRTWYIRNATTTAAMDLTFVTNTGILLKGNATTSTKVIYGDTDGANFGVVTLIRKPNTDFEALFTAYADGI